MPVLTVLAEPKGAGKTWYSNFLKQNTDLLSTTPFNFDLIDKEEIYSKLSGNSYNIENELARIKHTIFSNRCKQAISNNLDFSFECNLRSDQIKHINPFDIAG